MTTSKLGVVIIGRNEGDRLVRCIESAKLISDDIVYVDSGSCDGSYEKALEMGCSSIQLDMSVMFTAARARNTGWRTLGEANPNIELFHFVDGDCEIITEWVDEAVAYLANDKKCAVVCGRRVERFPEKSIYNRLCNIEWDTPIGVARACGGDAIIRKSAISDVNGYREDFIAGEEPEMCLRLRRYGWTIQRIAVDMTLHDAAMYKFSQWWKRTKRGGFAYALGSYVHGGKLERHWVAETRRAILWGGGIPAIIISLMLIHPLFVCLFGVYFLQWLKLSKVQYIDEPYRKVWSLFTILGKFPEFFGVCEFHFKRLFKKEMKLIEYK